MTHAHRQGAVEGNGTNAGAADPGTHTKFELDPLSGLCNGSDVILNSLEGSLINLSHRCESKKVGSREEIGPSDNKFFFL